MLLVTSFIWGSAIVSQSVGMDSVGPFTFNTVRGILGMASILVYLLLRDAKHLKGRTYQETVYKLAAYGKQLRHSIKNGLVLGVVFFLASTIQQHAFLYTSAGKIGFITAMYVVMVPIVGIFQGKKVKPMTWMCVAGGFVGLYFLSVGPDGLGALNTGDLLCLACAVFFTMHIVFIEKYSQDSDGVVMSCTQFFVAAILSAVMMFVTEEPTLAAIWSAKGSLLYAGILSSGLAYTLQIQGQKHTEASVASLIMCMESVFGVMCSALLLHEMMTSRELLGCVIMFAATVLSQLSEGFSISKKREAHDVVEDVLTALSRAEEEGTRLERPMHRPARNLPGMETAD